MIDLIVGIILFVGVAWLMASGGYRKPKKKRCKDCKWDRRGKTYCKYAFKRDYKGFAAPICSQYTRRFWKIWRPK